MASSVPKSFNLVDSPWVPVYMKDGTCTELSLHLGSQAVKRPNCV